MNDFNIDNHDEKYDIVFLWKQNDSGIYGRRADMLLKYLAQNDRVNKIVHFDAPIPIGFLESYRTSLQNQDGTHYGLIYKNEVDAYHGKKSVYGVKSYTYIFADKRAMRDDYRTIDEYFEYVDLVLKKHKIGENNKVILWNTPINHEFERWIGYLHPDYIVSDIIDDQRVWAGSDQERNAMTNNYRSALLKSNLVLCNSKEMYGRILKIEEQCRDKLLLVPNGCEEFDDSSVEKPDLLKTLQGPIVGQVSNLEKKIDIELLEECAKTHPEWNIVLIGSCHANEKINRLKKHSNIYLLGAIPYEESKRYIKNFDAAIIAHQVVSLNEAMNPLKLYVYCSLGVRVVSTDIPGIEDLKGVIKVAKDSKDFIAKIEETIKENRKYNEQEKEIINRYSWQSRVKEILTHIPEPSRLENRDSLHENGELSMKAKLKQKLMQFPGAKFAYRKWKNINDKIRDVHGRIDWVVGNNQQQIERLEEQIYELEKQTAFLASKVQTKTSSELPSGFQSDKVSVFVNIQNAATNVDKIVHDLKETITNYSYEILLVANEDLGIQYHQDESVILVNYNCAYNYAQGINAAVKYSSGQYYVFMDENVEVTDLWLDELMHVRKQASDIGTASLKLQYSRKVEKKTEEVPYKIYSSGITFEIAEFEGMPFLKPANRDRNQFNAYFDERYMEVEASPVELFGVEKNLFELVGGLNEIYNGYYANIDFNLRLSQRGYHNWISLNSYVYLKRIKKWNRKNASDKVRFRATWQSWLMKRKLGARLLEDGRPKNDFKVGLLCDPAKAKFSITDKKKMEMWKEYFEEKGADVFFYSPSEEGEKAYLDILVNFMPEQDMSIVNVAGAFNMLVCDTSDFVKDNGIQEVYDIILQEGQRGQDVSQNFQQEKNDMIKGIEDICKDGLNEKDIDICGAMPDGDARFSWGDYHYALSMKKEFELLGYRVHVRTYPKWFTCTRSKYVIVLRGLQAYYPKIEGQVNIMWNISHPEDVKPAEYNLYDLVYVASKRLAERLPEEVKVPVKVLLQCTDLDVMKYKEQEKRYELLFIGNSRGVYRKILQDLMPVKHKLTIYGRAWNGFPVAEYVADTYLDNREIGQAYHDAKIVLNDHWDDMREQGIVSNRLFDALAVNAFVISDYLPEIEELFRGKIITYDTPEELKEKVDYYMEHDEEREAVAAGGRTLIEGEHTFKCRVETILQDLSKEL